ncbi:unnamed protein product [Pieris brassicae]|uniref:Uncharacterized protein n=1 Tax=Pieris brassicae TaxID=7116 RepID=A0A9P0TUN1_PIEBR|nr:unnamed protein product [Pieris brassicae]
MFFCDTTNFEYARSKNTTNFEYARSKTNQSGWAFSRMRNTAGCHCTPRDATARRRMPLHAAGCSAVPCHAVPAVGAGPKWKLIR